MLEKSGFSFFRHPDLTPSLYSSGTLPGKAVAFTHLLNQRVALELNVYRIEGWIRALPGSSWGLDPSLTLSGPQHYLPITLG